MAKKKSGKSSSTDPGYNSVLAEKLSKAIQETPGVIRTAVTDDTPPPDALPAMDSFKGLKAGDLITVEYAMEPGRVPGIYGAEIVTVSKDGNDASIKFLYPNKPPRAAALKVVVRKGNAKEVIDAGDERSVLVRRPNREQKSSLEEIRISLSQRSPGKPPLKLNEVAAFVYPKAPAGAEWVPGVSIGCATKVEGKNYQVTFYFPDYLEEDPQYALDVVEMELGADGEYTDKKYGCKLAMVRKPTPGELQEFEESRKAVLSLKAIPNMPKPSKQESLLPSAPASAA